MTTRLLYLFTRTPLHVGAGSSVGAIDQPIVRERHTGFPVIPGSSLKGVLADLWSSDISVENSAKPCRDPNKEITWLFGSDDADNSSAGALSLGEARTLAFPIRSARGSYAWITSPLVLARAERDGVPGVTALVGEAAANLTGENGDSFALFSEKGALATPCSKNSTKAAVVLEDYVFKHAGELPNDLHSSLRNVMPEESIMNELKDHLVVVSDGMLGYFSRTACEIAQHVRIDDATGTADAGGLFNQENVPSETLFYSVVHASQGRSAAHRMKDPESAFKQLAEKLQSRHGTIQIGGDVTTGLGFCTVRLS